MTIINQGGCTLHLKSMTRKTDHTISTVGVLSVNSSAYKDLSAQGVHVKHLRVISYFEYRFSVFVTFPANFDREKLKRSVQHFLEREFEASEFEWKRNRMSPDGEAWCYFKSFAI